MTECENEPTAGQYHQMRIAYAQHIHIYLCLLPFSLQLRDRVDSQCAPLTWTLTAQIIRFEIAFSTVLRQTHLHLHSHFRYTYTALAEYSGISEYA